MARIQIFLENFILTCLSIIRIIILSDIFILLKQRKPVINCSRESVILANGPSLSESIDSNPEFLTGKDMVCVNFYPETSYYKQLKPRYFVTGAPELWIKDVSPEWEIKRNNLFETIKNQTDWDIIFLIPSLARKHKSWQNVLKVNPHIKITYYNITPVEGFKWFKHICFRLSLGMPRPHNVLTPSLMLILNYGYKRIFLLGADHSWLPEITVDNQNRVLLRHRHFYDENTASLLQMGTIKMGVRKLHEVLHKFYYTFAGYFIIKEYAESLEATIINATPDSFIDAFDRKSIKEI